MLDKERLLEISEANPLDWTAVASTGEIREMARELITLRSGHQPQERKSMLTNEDLNALKEFCEKSHLPILKNLAIEAFDELLTLRSLRDAGDEEVDAAKQDCINLLAQIVLARGIEHESRPPQPNPVPSYQKLRERIDKLRAIAIARGQLFGRLWRRWRG